MRVLADQDVYKLTIDELRKWGHDVVTVKELGMQRALDDDLLSTARKENRLLITRDKDFGVLLFLREKRPIGVILVRGAPRTIEKVHIQLQKLIKEQDEDELKSSFVVVEPSRYRIRHL